MKKLGNALMALGIVCLLSACGNDDYYTAMHMAYPLKELIMWTFGGFAFLGLGHWLKTIKLKG